MDSLISDYRDVTVRQNASFKEAIEKMESAGKGIALIADGREMLKGVLTNGDIRKALLNGVLLQDSIQHAMNPTPIVIKNELSTGEICRLMIEKEIRYLPLLTGSGKLYGIIYATALQQAKILTCPAVIMAGGLGTRLRPLTDHLPKPLLPLGDKPMIQHVIERLRQYGINEFFVSVNYKREMIEDFLGDGSWLRVRIHYLREKKRLGTAGALSMIKVVHDCSDILVVNADVVTDLNFHAMFQFHLDNANDLTIAVKKFNLQVPYGVVQLDMNSVTNLSEKPCITNYINAGIYIIKHRVIKQIPQNNFFDMTDLINKLVDESYEVGSYLIKGDWTDVGLPHEYEQVNGKLQSLDKAENDMRSTSFEERVTEGALRLRSSPQADFDERYVKGALRSA